MSMVDCCQIFKMFSLHPFSGIFTFYFIPTEFQELCLTVTGYSVHPVHTELNLSDETVRAATIQAKNACSDANNNAPIIL